MIDVEEMEKLKIIFDNPVIESACKELAEMIADSGEPGHIVTIPSSLTWMLSDFCWYGNWQEKRVYEICRNIVEEAADQAYRGLPADLQKIPDYSRDRWSRNVSGAEFYTLSEAWEYGLKKFNEWQKSVMEKEQKSCSGRTSA